MRLSTPHGALLVTDGAVAVVDAHGREAVAGSQVAADLVEMVLAGHPEPVVSGGSARVVRAGDEFGWPGAGGPGAGVERAVGVDMTNWAVIVDERWIVKVVRRWGGGERSVRQLERLAQAGSDLAPRTIGSVEWTLPGHATATVAVVSEYLPGTSDGWTWAVDDLLDHLGGAPAPTWPEALGEHTARLHLALAGQADSGGSSLDGATLRVRVHAALDHALAVVDGDTAERLRNRMSALRSLADAIPDSPAGRPIPLHGDLHVGQFLRTSGTPPRYYVVDLDGDPQHPLDPDGVGPAAADLAHLLVSVDLVGAIAQRRLGAPDARVTSWAAVARGELLDSYRASSHVAGSPPLLDERLLPALEAEQFARELGYAHAFLPRWQYAPDAGITARYTPAAGTKETPWTPPASKTT